MLSSIQMQPSVSHAFHWGVVIACCVAAAITDIRSRRIPNVLTAPMFLTGLAWGLSNGGLSGLGDSLVAALALALPYVVLFLIAGGGAADAKLMAAIGAWFGMHEGVVVLLCICISGAILGLGYALVKGRARAVMSNLVLMALALMSLVVGRRSWREVARQIPDSATMLSIPYGLAILTGVCVAAAGTYMTNFWM
ncbi:MAG TPA: A24 family peptidase [Tepidisphaeraceae bacterium]